MPDETRIWAVPVGTSPNSRSDSRIRSMKLSERSLSRKVRERKLIVPSDSPFQKRTLTKFPMEYNRTESKRNADGQHFVRKLTEDKVRKAKIDSEQMRQYSLKMFDNAVEIHDQNAKIEVPLRMKSAHNGPTHSGSVLYNKRSCVMNSIRLRPKSEPPARFNHLKSQTIQPQIKQTLCKSNRDYTVSCVSPTKLQSARSISTLSTRSDFMLIPNGSLSSEDMDYVKSDLNDSVFEDQENCSNTSTIVPMDPAFRKRNLPSAKIHFYSIEEDSDTDDIENVAKSPEVPQTDEPKKNSIAEPAPETSSPKSGKGRPKSSRSPKRSASPKAKAKRGK